MPQEIDRQAEIQTLLHWTDPGPGGIYINFGSGNLSPYLVPGLPYEQDPAFLRGPARKYPYRKSQHPLRLAWRGFTGPLNDQHLQVRFPDLDPNGRYQLRLIYSEPQSHHDPVKFRLDAGDDVEIHPYIDKPAQATPMVLDLPREAICAGTLTLTWRREPGKGGVGLGCDLSELWLIKIG
jgi:hypothetical protein